LDLASLRTGVYLDLPKHRSEFIPLTGVDEECINLTTSQSDDKEVAERVLTDVLQMKRSVNWQVGLAGVAEVVSGTLGGSFDLSFANGSLSDVGSTCMNYNSTTASYMDANSVMEDPKKNTAAGLWPSACAIGWMILLGVVMVIVA
jgi:hypothetical protein